MFSGSTTEASAPPRSLLDLGSESSVLYPHILAAFQTRLARGQWCLRTIPIDDQPCIQTKMTRTKFKKVRVKCAQDKQHACVERTHAQQTREMKNEKTGETKVKGMLISKVTDATSSPPCQADALNPQPYCLLGCNQTTLYPWEQPMVDISLSDTEVLHSISDDELALHIVLLCDTDSSQYTECSHEYGKPSPNVKLEFQYPCPGESESS